MTVIAPAVLEQIRSRLEDVMEARGLRRARGRTWHCCFHPDKTPSVNTARGRYHCFSCQKHLDTIAFVQELDGVDFRTAVSAICQELGIPLDTSDALEYARRSREAQAEAELLVQWRNCIQSSLLEYEHSAFRLFHCQKRRILSGGLSDDELGDAMEQAELAEQKYLAAEKCRDVLTKARWSELIPLFRERSSKRAA